MLVERQSRISFECPADILMEGLMEDLLNDDVKGPGADYNLDSILNKLLEDKRGVAYQMRVYGCVDLDWARATVCHKVTRSGCLVHIFLYHR